jgi:phosphoglycerate dehydrogenase-like enzyme
MHGRPIPPRDQLIVGLAHPTYLLKDALKSAAPDLQSVEFRTRESLIGGIANIHVLMQASVLWSNDLLDRAQELSYIQSISVGVEHFDHRALRERSILLANAGSVVSRPVAEHAISLMLSLVRRLGPARDFQVARKWRGRIADPTAREDELGGKTLLIIGLGAVGKRVARMAKAFEMTVLGIRRGPRQQDDQADEIYSPNLLGEILPRADIILISCPLTPETEMLIDHAMLQLAKPSAFLINVARGKIVDEAAMIEAMAERRIAGAGLDCFCDEPLSPSSPLWGFDNAIITSHVAAETRYFEDRIVRLLLDNIELLSAGGRRLQSQIEFEARDTSK